MIKAGKVRGLVCHPCNVMLGMARDSVQTLWNAIKYLQDAQVAEELEVQC
jgi:hypothetical protein